MFASGPDFIHANPQVGFDLTLLDWNLPEMSGLEELEYLLRNNWNIDIEARQFCYKLLNKNVRQLDAGAL